MEIHQSDVYAAAQRQYLKKILKFPTHIHSKHYYILSKIDRNT